MRVFDDKENLANMPNYRRLFVIGVLIAGLPAIADDAGDVNKEIGRAHV